MRVNVNGVSLFFEVEGTKLAASGGAYRERPTIVALHGGPGLDHSDVRAGLAPLARVAQLVYLDQRGHGRSDRSAPAHWNLEQWADDLRGFCDALALERPVIFGNSFGGMVALAYAIRYPGHAGKLVLHSTAAHFELSAALEAFSTLGGHAAAGAARRFFAAPDPDAFAEYLDICFPLYGRKPPAVTGPPSIVHLDVAEHFLRGEWRTFDLRPRLPEIDCPTLVLAGQHDVVFPEVCWRALVGGLRPDRVRLERFAGCGHALLADAPREVCESVATFASP